MQITPIALAGFVPAAVTGLVVIVATLPGSGAPALAAAATAPPASAPVIKTTAPPATSVNLAAPAPAAPKRPAPAPAAPSPAAPSPAPAAPQPAPAPAAAPAPQSDAEVAATCVAYRESTGNPAASPGGLYGILPSTWAQLGYSGTAAGAPVAVQAAAFGRLYAEQGTAPWAQYDGC